MNSQSMSGKWKNQHGSILEFSLKRDGTFKGTYLTKVGDSEVINKKCPASGKIKFPLITFNVDFGKAPFQSLTTWIGRFEKNGKKYELRTMWVLVADCHDENGSPKKLDEWQIFQTNADIFKKNK